MQMVESKSSLAQTKFYKTGINPEEVIVVHKCAKKKVGHM